MVHSLTLAISLFLLNMAHAKVLEIGCGRKPGTRSTQFFEAIYNEIGKEIGIKISIKYVPSRRSLASANEGTFDGDTGRILKLNKNGKFPNLVRVDEVIFEEPFEAWGTNTSIKISSWEDLKKHRVAKMLGIKFVEKNIPKGTRVLKAGNEDQALTLIKNGRADIFVYGKSQIKDVIIQSKYENFKKLGTTGSIVLYPYLNKKNANLIAKFDSALKKIKKSGRYQKIYNETIGGQ